MLVSLLLAACTHPKPTSHTFKINIESEPQTLDPRKVVLHNEITLSRLLHEGLFKEQGKEIVPAIAATYEISADGLRYTFTLREAKWSNQMPITAADFIRSWKSTLTPTFPSSTAHLLFPIKNAEAIKRGELSPEALGVAALGDQTLVVTLEKRTPHFLALLTLPVFSPLAPVENAYSGPYALKLWEHNSTLCLEKNPAYWNKRTFAIDKIECIMVEPMTALELFEQHAIDWQGAPFSNIPIDALDVLAPDKASVLHTVMLRLNTTHPYLKSSKLRRALGYAINRQAITAHVMRGGQTPATRLIPVACGISQEEYFHDADIETAQRLFYEALSELSLPPSALEELTLLSRGGPSGKLCEAIQNQWRQVFGITIPLRSVERNVFFSQVSKLDYTIALADRIADFNDPIEFLDIFRWKTATSNNTGWENPRFTELLALSEETQNPTERRRCLHKAEEILMEEMPIIPLYHNVMLYLHNPRLHNAHVTVTGALDLSEAYLDTKESL